MEILNLLKISNYNTHINKKKGLQVNWKKIFHKANQINLNENFIHKLLENFDNNEKIFSQN